MQADPGVIIRMFGFRFSCRDACRVIQMFTPACLGFSVQL